MKKNFFVVIFIMLFFIPSCKSTGFLMGKAKVVMIGDAYPAKSTDATIDVFYTQVPSEYIEIAQITCGDTDDEWCLQQIKIKAREIGADAIIIIGKASSYGVGIPIGYTTIVSTESYGINSIAIKYKD